MVPAQAPFVHTSLCVQAFPSSHEVPFATTGVEQMPVLLSQVPTTWQASLGEQVTGLLPAQVPDLLH